MNGAGHHGETDSMLARLKRLPLRLRVAHLAALIRCGKVIVREGSLSYPSPHERERAAGREGRSEAEARVGGPCLAPPTPMLSGRRFASPRSFASTSRASLLASDPTAPRGEGLNIEPMISTESAGDQIMSNSPWHGGRAE
jgi:hypothetical protein